MNKDHGEIVRQPNGLFARWVSKVAGFTHFNMTITQASELLVEYGEMNEDEALKHVEALQWNRCLEWHCAVEDLAQKHGHKRADQIREAMSRPAYECQMIPKRDTQ